MYHEITARQCKAIETWSVNINCKVMRDFKKYQSFLTSSNSTSPIVGEVGGRGDSL